MRTMHTGMRRGVLLGLAAIAAALLAGCAESTALVASSTVAPRAEATKAAPTATAAPTVASTASPASSATAPVPQPTVASQPTAAPTATTAPKPTQAPEATAASEPDADEEIEVAGEAVVPPPPLEVAGCAPGMSTDEQKATLVKMAKARFAGVTVFKKDLSRLQYQPEARNNRRGGIWLVVEFNGDDQGEVAEKKASLDLWMREAYDLFYNSGCDELTQVDLSGYGEALGRPPIGPTVVSHAIVFKTRMTRDVAEAVDWANKESLDFDEIWDVQIINVRWKRDLAGEPSE